MIIVQTPVDPYANMKVPIERSTYIWEVVKEGFLEKGAYELSLKDEESKPQRRNVAVKPHDWTAEDAEIKHCNCRAYKWCGRASRWSWFLWRFCREIGSLQSKNLKRMDVSQPPIWQPSESASIHMVSPVQSWVALRLLVSFFNWHVTLYSF